MEVQWAGISLPNREATRTAVVGSETGVAPDVNQIQLSPDIARTVPRRAHEVLGIVTESWSPLGRGPELRENPTIVQIAADVGRTAAQVVLRWHVQQGLVPVPRSSDPKRLVENLSVFDFRLSTDQMATLASLDNGEAAARDSDLPENGH